MPSRCPRRSRASGRRPRPRRSCATASRSCWSANPRSRSCVVRRERDRRVLPRVRTRDRRPIGSGSAERASARRAWSRWNRSWPAARLNVRSKLSGPRSVWRPTRARSCPVERAHRARLPAGAPRTSPAAPPDRPRCGGAGPQVLVVADERRLVVGDDPAIPARDDDLGVRDVTQALEHGPLVGLRAFGDAGAGLSDHLAPGVGGRGLHVGRIVVADQTGEVPLVLGRLGDRVGCGTRSI